MPKSQVWLTSKLQPASCQEGSMWHLDHPTLPDIARKERIPCLGRPKDHPVLLRSAEGGDGSTGYCASEVYYLCQSLTKCVLQSGARVPWLPCPHGGGRQPVQHGDGDMGGVRKDPMATTPSKRAPSLTPRAEEPTSATAPSLHPHLDQKGLYLLRTWPWCWEGGHCHLRFSPLGSGNPAILPLEDVYGDGAMPMGTLLDLTALESLQVTISHTPATGKVH